MQFVDEQNDLPVGFRDFLQHRFQAVLEFAAIFRAGNQRGEIQCDHALRTQHFRHIARDDALREAFHDGGFSNAGLADQHGIIFRAARENLHDAADFIVAADHRIELAAPREFDQVAPVLFEGAEGRFRILRSHAMAAAHRGQRLQDRFARGAILGQKFRGLILANGGDGQQDVLGGNVFVLELLRFDESAFENFVRRRAHLLLHRSRHFRDAPEPSFNFTRESVRTHAEPREQRRDDAILLRDERAQKMQRLDLLMIVARGDVLRRLNGFLGF